MAAFRRVDFFSGYLPVDIQEEYAGQFSLNHYILIGYCGFPQKMVYKLYIPLSWFLQKGL
jgi:hypothetical protein